MTQCKACGAEIIFVPTEKGRVIPLDVKPEKRMVLIGQGPSVRMVDAYMPHFATCPEASKFRKGKKDAPPA